MAEEIFINRGLTKDEVRALLTSPMPNRERAFFRAIYDTCFRANELLQCNIEDYNRKTGEIIARHTKRKYNSSTKKTVQPPPKHMLLSRGTRILFRKLIGNRKKGAIFINRRGNRISITHFQVFINELATSIGIQKVAKVTDYGEIRHNRPQHLVSLKALREAGERHHDLGGGDSDLSARAAQHSAIVKERYYKKTGWEEIQDSFRKHHPAFQEDW